MIMMKEQGLQANAKELNKELFKIRSEQMTVSSETFT